MAVWRDDIRSWGRTVAARHLVSRPSSVEEAEALVAQAGSTTLLGYGNGRAYGDESINPDGRLIDCAGLDKFLSFDRDTGVLRCEAGVLLSEILTILCRPDADGSGWFLPATPGTRFITVGGAIANDVHGKNHHRVGTFGQHVLSFDLVRSDGRLVTCSKQNEPELFAATIGGMGLTGLIVRAAIQLHRVEGTSVEAEDIRFDRLEQFFELSAESDAEWEYTAAWIDSLATGRQLGRGVFSRARHDAGRGTAPPSRTPRINVPMTSPVALPNRMGVGLFNALYWRKLGWSYRRSTRGANYAPILYPLDAVGGWNRVYGRRGFYQFQCVVPHAGAVEVLQSILRRVAGSGQGSALSVLKVFGAHESPGLMSFPMPGATLTLDFANRGEPTLGLLRELERIAVSAGGRIYAAKDGCMSAASLRAGYPNLDRFRRSMDPMFSSALARRLEMTGAG